MLSPAHNSGSSTGVNTCMVIILIFVDWGYRDTGYDRVAQLLCRLIPNNSTNESVGGGLLQSFGDFYLSVRPSQPSFAKW